MTSFDDKQSSKHCLIFAFNLSYAKTNFLKSFHTIYLIEQPNKRCNKVLLQTNILVLPQSYFDIHLLQYMSLIHCQNDRNVYHTKIFRKLNSLGIYATVNDHQIYDREMHT